MDKPLILVVDDEEMLRDCTSMVLGYLNFDVITARDGFEGIEVYKANYPKIFFVLMDANMPRMDGYTAMQGIFDFDPLAKVVMSSGDIFYRENIAPTAFIHKPYRVEELKKVIEGLSPLTP